MGLKTSRVSQKHFVYMRQSIVIELYRFIKLKFQFRNCSVLLSLLLLTQNHLSKLPTLSPLGLYTQESKLKSHHPSCPDLFDPQPSNSHPSQRHLLLSLLPLDSGNRTWASLCVGSDPLDSLSDSTQRS